MRTATLDRCPVGVLAATRAAQLAEVSAETAEWIAADLERRERGAGRHAMAADRIRHRAAIYRAEAQRLRSD